MAKLVIAHIPNYVGLVLCITLLWRILQHEWDNDDHDDDDRKPPRKRK